ncbi:MAG: hypothetical protein HY777_04965 [Betaproteobacteria bacterium]|nr:hypothetical protein [Betaproteobacteria bacterium]
MAATMIDLGAFYDFLPVAGALIKAQNEEGGRIASALFVLSRRYAATKNQPLA